MKKVKLKTPSLIEAPESLSLQDQMGLLLHDYRLSNTRFTMPVVLLVQEQKEFRTKQNPNEQNQNTKKLHTTHT